VQADADGQVTAASQDPEVVPASPGTGDAAALQEFPDPVINSGRVSFEESL
jgi:hypothetical protein